METHAARRDGNRLSPVRLNNIFVRAKTANSENNRSENWQSRWFSPSGSLVSNSEGSCRSCHNRVKDRDYMFTLPQLLNSTKTNQLQRRQTEFGSSVCRQSIKTKEEGRKINFRNARTPYPHVTAQIIAITWRIW